MTKSAPNPCRQLLRNRSVCQWARRTSGVNGRAVATRTESNVSHLPTKIAVKDFAFFGFTKM